MSKFPLGFNFHLIWSSTSIKGLLALKIWRKATPSIISQSLESQTKQTSQLLLSPAPSLVKEDSIETSLSVAIPYSLRKASWKGWSSHHPPYQNLTLFPIPTTNWVFLLKSSQPTRIPFHKPHPWTLLPNLEVHPHTFPQTLKLLPSSKADSPHFKTTKAIGHRLTYLIPSYHPTKWVLLSPPKKVPL